MVSVKFYRTPPDGSELYEKWKEILSSSASTDTSFEHFDYVCQLHFEPEDFYMEMNGDEPIYKLHDDAVPMSIGSSCPENGAQDMKFIDINQFLNIRCDANIKSETLTNAKDQE